MTRRRKSRAVQGLGGNTFIGSYKQGISTAAKFIGERLAGAIISALTFAFVYKYIVAKDATNKEQGQ